VPGCANSPRLPWIVGPAELRTGPSVPRVNRRYSLRGATRYPRRFLLHSGPALIRVAWSLEPTVANFGRLVRGPSRDSPEPNRYDPVQKKELGGFVWKNRLVSILGQLGGGSITRKAQPSRPRPLSRPAKWHTKWVQAHSDVPRAKGPACSGLYTSVSPRLCRSTFTSFASSSTRTVRCFP